MNPLYLRMDSRTRAWRIPTITDEVARLHGFQKKRRPGKPGPPRWLRGSRGEARSPLGAVVESGGVLERRERRVLVVVVDLDRAGLRVGHLGVDLDVGQAAGEDPEVLVQRAGVQHLQDHLDVGVVEEPEIAGVAGQRHRLAGAGLPGRSAPGDVDREATAAETETGGARDAAAAAHRDI